MIFLVRHAEPSAGWGAHPDPGLSELGQAQASRVAEQLAEAGAKRVITSPLARCRATAMPYERLMETHARIEVDFGEIRSPPAIADRPAWLLGLMEGTWSQTDGAFDQWRSNALAAVEACADETVIFSHFMAINAIIGKITNDDRVLVFRPGHASITRLEHVGGRLVVNQLGDEGALQVL